MKDRKVTIPIIAALVIAVISLGVAFATFSASLSINGNATVQSSSWDIHFSETEKTSASTGLAPADPGVTLTPTIVSETAQNVSNTLTRDTFSWTGTFKSPNDTLEYRFYIVNSGDYNATLSAPIVNSPVCKINNETQGTCPITYTVTKDGTNSFTGSDSLAAGASQLVVVKAVLNSNYGGDGSSLASTNIDVSMSTVTFTYTQNGAAQSQSGGSGSGSGAAANATYYLELDYQTNEPVWGTLAELAEDHNGVVPSIYLKNVNGVIYGCYNASSEACYLPDDTEASFRQLCTSTGGTAYTIEEYTGSDGDGFMCIYTSGDQITMGIGSATVDENYVSTDWLALHTADNGECNIHKYNGSYIQSDCTSIY